MGYPEPVVGIEHILELLGFLYWVVFPRLTDFPDGEETGRTEEEQHSEPWSGSRAYPEADLVHQDERAADGCHECGRDQCDEVFHAASFLRKEDCQGPEREHCQCLVGPAEILPDGVETVLVRYVEPEQKSRGDEDRDADNQSVAYRSLVDVESLGNNHPVTEGWIRPVLVGKSTGFSYRLSLFNV